MSKSARHGEAFLIKVSEMPNGKVKKVREYIVAHSESGNHHILKSETEFEVMDDEELYLRLFEPATLEHQKTIERHEDIVLEPGIYKKYQAVEWDFMENVARRVFD